LDELPIILVVEDDEPIQDIIKHALTDAGFDVTISASGDEALILLGSCLVKYRGLVTDINLKGGMNGWEEARQVREIDPSFPVV
jgi:DNA-binding response OmpR family regulator